MSAGGNGAGWRRCRTKAVLKVLASLNLLRLSKAQAKFGSAFGLRKFVGFVTKTIVSSKQQFPVPR